MMSWKYGVGNKADLVPCFLSPFLNPFSKRRLDALGSSVAQNVVLCYMQRDHGIISVQHFLYSMTLCVNDVINNRLNVGTYDFYRQPRRYVVVQLRFIQVTREQERRKNR